MHRLPIEVLQVIFDYVVWDNPEELYELRNVSPAWKAAIERSGSRVFKLWYNRCKKDIPEDHLLDIVKVKYPLVAHPWQESYWVDSGLPYVAKTAYEIWKGFPNFDDSIDRKPSLNYPFLANLNCENDRKHNVHLPEGTTVGLNDKYWATSYPNKEYDDEDYYGFGDEEHDTDDEEHDSDDKDEKRVTDIYRWNNPKEPIRNYDMKSDQVDFYTTEKGTFAVLSRYDKPSKDWEIYVSKHPIDSPDLSSEFTLLSRNECCITQNECFYIIDRNSTRPKILKHGKITEDGFQTNTFIEPPADLESYRRYEWRFVRVEICRSTLYVMHKGGDKLACMAKYKISRDSAGKLSFTLEDWDIIDRGVLEENDTYRHIYEFWFSCIWTENFYLMDYAFATENFFLWLMNCSYLPGVAIRPLAIHANYVICEQENYRTEQTGICIFHKDNLTEAMEADNSSRLKAVMRFDFPVRSKINWIGIVYIGLKAQIMVQHYDNCLCLVDFY